MTVHEELPPEVEAFLAHYGVKGMRWGVRNDDKPIGGYRLQATGPTVDARLHPSSQKAGKDVARLMEKRYGFKITEIAALTPDHPAYDPSTFAFVRSTPGVKGGVIYANTADFRKPLKDAEKAGFFADGCGHSHSGMTHEAAHALFHAEQSVQVGLFKSKVVGGNIEARNTALKESMAVANASGISSRDYINKVSGYASYTQNREEMEGELFAQYHWGTNPPPFVKTWGETLHREMGIDPTPFREEG